MAPFSSGIVAPEAPVLTAAAAVCLALPHLHAQPPIPGVSLRVIVVELSFWVGVAGIGIAGLLLLAVGKLAAMGSVPMFFPLWLLGLVSVLLLFIALMSGTMSLGMLKKSQPADLLR